MLKQVHTMSRVLRTLGVDTNLTFSGGRSQRGVKLKGIGMARHLAMVKQEKLSTFESGPGIQTRQGLSVVVVLWLNAAF